MLWFLFYRVIFLNAYWVGIDLIFFFRKPGEQAINFLSNKHRNKYMEEKFHSKKFSHSHRVSISFQCIRPEFRSVLLSFFLCGISLPYIYFYANKQFWPFFKFAFLIFRPSKQFKEFLEENGGVSQ